MRVLVLGGTGFIGSHIVDALVDSDHHVKVVDRTLKYIQTKNPQSVQYTQADYSDSFILSEALLGIDIVIHLVSTTVPGNSNLDPVADIQSNLVNSVKLFQAMKHADVKRIIYFSSGGTVYGNPSQIPISENHPTHPICSYGITKVAIENYLYMFQELYGFKPTILRPSNPYGPRQGHHGAQGVIGTFMNQIMTNHDINIWGDGSVIRDYIYISDLVDACLAVVNSDVQGTFNIGSGCGHSLLDIIGEIERCTQRKSQVNFDHARCFDVNEMVLDSKLAKNKLAWSPKYTLQQGIRLHYDWYKSAHKD